MDNLGLPTVVAGVLAQASALRIFLRVVQQSLVSACPGAAKADPASLHLGAVAFIHRFGSSLNTHVHFHVCVVDGVLELLAGADLVNAPPVTFHPAQIDDAAIATVQANVRKRLLRAHPRLGGLLCRKCSPCLREWLRLEPLDSTTPNTDRMQ